MNSTVCVFMWDQLHLCDGLFKNRQWHLHLDDLFDDSLWDVLLALELRLRTTVFAGEVNVTLSNSECFFTKSFRRRVSENSDWFSFR